MLLLIISLIQKQPNEKDYTNFYFCHCSVFMQKRKYDIPGGTAPNGSNTPEGLYNELKSMQAQGVESNNIDISGYKGFVASSDGPCN